MHSINMHSAVGAVCKLWSNKWLYLRILLPRQRQVVAGLCLLLFSLSIRLTINIWMHFLPTGKDWFTSFRQEGGDTYVLTSATVLDSCSMVLIWSHTVISFKIFNPMEMNPDLGAKPVLCILWWQRNESDLLRWYRFSVIQFVLERTPISILIQMWKFSFKFQSSVIFNVVWYNEIQHFICDPAGFLFYT